MNDGYIKVQYLLDFCANQRDHSISPNDIMRMPYVGWISVKDRLPEEEKLYLVFRKEQPRMMVLEYNTEKKEFGWTDYPTCRWNKREGVTHWMPLPEPPKEEKC